jgi:acetyl-CoA carboxylase biotin carboxyl carrier protein
MERERPKRGGAFNTEEIADLLEKFEASSLSEMHLRAGDSEITFRRGGTPHQVPPMAHAPADQAASPQPAAGPNKAPRPAEAPGLEKILSPIVGTFYRSPAPDAPPFVERGSKVQKGQTLCILEAMKLMNQLEAEFDCEIVSVLVENGKMVEYGTPLFEVRRP